MFERATLPGEDLAQRAASAGKTRVYLDLTHLGRHVTGIERVSIEQFEKVTFEKADVRPIRSSGLASMIWKQQVALPWLALIDRRALFVFPGFPPSPLFRFAKSRVLHYVHDLFLITRPQDLSLKAALYMAWPFRMAVKGLSFFAVNSEKTASDLRDFARENARIALYRPFVRNVFGLSPDGRSSRNAKPEPLKIVMIGTIEPRKNYSAAGKIAGAMKQAGFPDTQLHVIGREGWGNDLAELKSRADVTVHGYLSLEAARSVIEEADVYLSTSHDEGLGLPLLEGQFAGLPVVAADLPVFREALGESGTYIDPARPEHAANRIAQLIRSPSGVSERRPGPSPTSTAGTNWPAKTPAARAACLQGRWRRLSQLKNDGSERLRSGTACLIKPPSCRAACG